jgi:hypothetical protein
LVQPEATAGAALNDVLVIVPRAAEFREPGKPADTDVDVVVRSWAGEFTASETCGAAD